MPQAAKQETEVGLEVGPRDQLDGRFAGRNVPSAVSVLCDGRHWATVDVDAGERRFACQLPPCATATDTRIEIRDAGTMAPLARLDLASRAPLRNGHGLSAHEVLKVHGLPMLAVPWLSFDGARLTVSGAHLPPAGDPAQLRVVFGPGVAYEFRYPLDSPEFANHFWYWPNADRSGFILTIDLPACEAGSDPFLFHFDYDNGDPLNHGPGRTGDSLSRLVAIPPRLDAAICFPGERTQLTRVQTWSNSQSVTFTGYSAYKTIELLLARYGVRPGPGLNVLDWGCGHGRIARHVIQNWPRANVFGGDVDAENVAWCAKHLAGRFETFPLVPPTSLPGALFDVVFGISVMTHLTAEMQAEWLREIARLLKPTGIALVSFAGPGAAAFSSAFRETGWWQDWLRSGFDADQRDPALDGRIADADYYRNTVQTSAYTRERWSEHLDVVDIVPDLLGNQDVVVLRRPPARSRPSRVRQRVS